MQRDSKYAGLCRWVALTAVFLAAAGAPPVCAGVHVALVPSAAQVAPGTEFDVHLRVTQEGDAFNGYTAVIAFDPAALTFVPMPAGTQEGSYMALACGSSAQSCTPGTGQVSISHTLLCLGLSLTGPGDLYVLRFRAATVPRYATLHFASIQFYYAGRFVALSEAVDAQVQIGNPSDAFLPGAGAFEMHAAPNPFTAATVLQARAWMPGATAAVYDARGRLVCTLAPARPNAGGWALRWDGRTSDGTPARSGVYWITVSSGAQHASTRVVRVD